MDAPPRDLFERDREAYVRAWWAFADEFERHWTDEHNELVWWTGVLRWRKGRPRGNRPRARRIRHRTLRDLQRRSNRRRAARTVRQHSREGGATLRRPRDFRPLLGNDLRRP